jgi:acyl-coenzyme A thioesterase PaaI-like protein
MTSRSIIDFLKSQYGDRLDDLLVPPPSFDLMQGEFVDYDADAGWVVTRFPVRDSYMNPYGSMQGGFVAAAVDNTFGPLSMLVGPPNVTRRLEMKYSRAVTQEMGAITVRAEFLSRNGRWLEFKATVRSPDGQLLARSWAKHWITDPV